MIVPFVALTVILIGIGYFLVQGVNEKKDGVTWATTMPEIPCSRTAHVNIEWSHKKAVPKPEPPSSVVLILPVISSHLIGFLCNWCRPQLPGPHSFTLQSSDSIQNAHKDEEEWSQKSEQGYETCPVKLTHRPS